MGECWAAAAVILILPSGHELCYTSRLEFPCTNNMAEYEILVLALRKVTTAGAKRLLVKSDSQVVVG